MELLLVMAILALFFLVASFIFLNYYQKAKKSSFITDSRVIYRESNKIYSSEYMDGKEFNVISSDEGEKHLDIDNPNIKYCINLDEKGKVDDFKMTNGEYYLQGKVIDDISIENVVFGNFDAKFSCDYVLSNEDILEETILLIKIDSTVMKIIKALVCLFIGLLILFPFIKNKNERI